MDPSPLWTHQYNDFEASLYHNKGLVVAKLKTPDGSPRMVERVVFGVLGDRSALDLIQCCAQKALKNNIAIFPYPSLNNPEEVWVFETKPGAAYHLWKAKEIRCNGISAENYQTILKYLKAALKIQGSNQELEKAILDTKQKLFLLQAESCATAYLCEAEKVLFLNMKEGIPAFDQLLEWIHTWKGEKQPHVYLMRVVVYEFLLDQPLLAADSYASLAQVSEDTKALACMGKACSFFKRTDPVLNYAHFLEKIDRKFLVKFVEKYTEFNHILLEKDAIRMTFERALVLFNKPSPTPKCFICCSPQDEEVVSWVHHALAFDLQKIGVTPIYAAQDLSHIGDYKSFQEKISSANKVVVICTPELKAKCMSDPPMGVAEEIRLVIGRYEKSELAGGISLLYLQGNRQTSCPSPFLEPIFAGQHATADQPIEKTIFNYYDRAFEFFAPLTGLSNLKALEIKECFIDAIKDILNGKISQDDVDKWRKDRWEKKELGSLQDLQRIYSRLENTQPHLLIQQDLRDHYASNTHLTLLVSQKKIPIKQLYTRLAIIGEAEKKKTKKETEETKPGHSLELEDRRPLTHESIFEPKKAILLEELFKHDQLKGATKRILIQGSAGIGKSTLCHHIAYRWAQKTLFTEFEYLLWLPLRRLNPNFYSNTGTDWADYVAKECGLESAQVRKLFSNEETQKKTLVLLDGYDELSGDATNNQGCFYPVLQALKAFPNIIITSRPREIRDFKDKEPVILEILGFDSKGIEEYVEHFFSKDQQVQAQNLRTQLQQPLVRSLAHIPINLEIFCSLIAANEPLFNASESPTLTGIYIKLTDWLFKWFRIERNKKDPNDVISEPDTDSAFDVSHLTEVMEQIAWEAMDQNTLYPTLTSITKIYRAMERVRNVAIGIESIQNVGPLRIEDNQGVFIHLTFQEYFAAAHLARLYQNNQQEAGKLLAKIKFEPRYRLVLWMTAGSLSQKEKLKHLQAFFKDLYSEPRDLAESYELSLFAQCFEECLIDHLPAISYDKTFLPSVVAYMNKAPFQEMNFQLLNRNTNLIWHSLIIDTLLKMMAHTQKQRDVLVLLIYLAQEKLPPKIVDVVQDMLSNTSSDGGTRAYQAAFLCKLIESRQELPQKGFNALVHMVKTSSFSIKERIPEMIFETLGKITGGEQAWSAQVPGTLIGIIRYLSVDSKVNSLAINALGRIAGAGQKLSATAFKALIEIIGDASLREDTRWGVIDNLSRLVKYGEVSSAEASFIILREIANGNYADFKIHYLAHLELRDLINWRKRLSAESLESLLSMVHPRSPEDTRRLALFDCLRNKDVEKMFWIPPSDIQINGEVIETLSTGGARKWWGVLSEPKPASCYDILKEAVKNLYKSALDAQETPDILLNLETVACDLSLEMHNPRSAIEALGKIAESGQALPPSALLSLVKMAGDAALDEDVRGRAMWALKKIRSSQLIQHLDSVKEVCYLTHRAWVVSEHQVSISDSKGLSKRTTQSLVDMR